MKALVLILICAISSVSVVANADVENTLHQRFLRAIGLYDQIDQQLKAIEAVGADTARQYATQIVDAFPAGVPDEFSDYMQKEMENYMNKINEAMDSEIMADTYMGLITKQLTDSELSELIKFYESDLGRKFTEANTEVSGEWAVIIQGDMQKKMEVFTQEFVDSLMQEASSY